MAVVFDILYLLAAPAVGLFLAIKSLRTGKYRSDWAARFGRYPKTPRAENADATHLPRRILLHCVSVGELLSMRFLIDKLLAADPDLQIILTTTTDTGTARARELYGTPDAPKPPGRVLTYRYPIDLSCAVRGFLNHTRPDLIALVELETWPNFIYIAHARRIPIVILNGRLTERSGKRYRLIYPIMAGMLHRIAWLGIQTRTIADRFTALGASPDRITILPTLKYDSADLSDTIPGADALAAACGIAPDHILFVAGSTGPGEETALLETYLALRTRYPALRLAIAPRKPETVPQTIAAITASNLTPLLRTDHPDAPTPQCLIASVPQCLSPNDVLLLNTLGELKKLYARASFVFVGRSLIPLGGSDMIEVAALAKPCCFGPHTQNFTEAVELLLKENAAIQLPNAAALTPALESWLANPAAARDLGQRARAVIAAQRGSTDRYVARLLTFLPPPETKKQK